MYRPDLSPVADSLALSALVGALPLLTLFVLLGGLRLKAHWAGLAALGTSVVVAVWAYGMPVDLALLAGTEGAAFGLFPIMWIVLAALWVHQLTVTSGRFADLRGAFNLVSGDPRVQALIIAFCFGALLEALAGFGAPVAITGVMLTALGFSPVRAAVTVLVANTAPVAFGAIATPIITAGSLTGIAPEDIGAYVGRQTPLLALFVPLLLVALVDGVRGIRQTWPVALVCGGAFAVAQFVSANYLSVELTDIIAALVALAAVVGFLRVWQPGDGERVREDLRRAAGRERLEQRETDDDTARAGTPGDGTSGGDTARGGATSIRATAGAAGAAPLTGSRIVLAFVPYLVVITVFAVAKLWEPAKEFLAGSDVTVRWPGLDGEVLTAAGKPSSTTAYVFPWLSSPGSLLLLCGLLVAAAHRVRPVDAVREFGRTVLTLRWALLTVGSVLALAYVMNLSGQTITIGTWIAGAGAAFAFLSPLLGWLGTAVTGSDTSANALFATLQQTAAGKAGLDPTLLVAANTSGGVVGKMISPQNLTIAATAVGLLGKEAVLFRKAVAWSLLLLLAICLLVLLQSHALSWMLP
ncbi:L-lactate permease [Streptomyces albus subsp. chlorinus]|uniref:L-lactate permease n=1 Tax=Streptomyces albus TaxID=1888 RepID=UPI00156FE5DE|nr:L-lactate permease [Streptomyces albus]NSC24752.1 L-lactate permease [Streptomyces albus subsp. chlorinus]